MIDLVLLSSCDETARLVTSMALACDMGAGLEVRHEPVVAEDGSQQVCCTAADLSGVVRREYNELEHGCVSCTVRVGLVPMLRWVGDQGRWGQVLVTLPVAAPSDAVAHELDAAIRDGELAEFRLARVVAAVDPSTLEDDLLGDDLLSERGLALSDHDERAVGEALAHQLDCADVTVCTSRPGARAKALLEHVLPPQAELVASLGRLEAMRLFVSRHDVAQTMRRLAPQRRMLRTRHEREGVWSLVLDSPSALHPGRLLDQIELLGRGRIRARGCFWVPSRPHAVCVWDGAGGQLSIGEAGLWRGERRTRILVTGVDDQDRQRIQRAFADVLLTPHERSAAGVGWAVGSDGLEPWLGAIGGDELGEVG